jgi:hypothetical protein
MHNCALPTDGSKPKGQPAAANGPSKPARYLGDKTAVLFLLWRFAVFWRSRKIENSKDLFGACS